MKIIENTQPQYQHSSTYTTCFCLASLLYQSYRWLSEVTLKKIFWEKLKQVFNWQHHSSKGSSKHLTPIKEITHCSSSFLDPSTDCWWRDAAPIMSAHWHQYSVYIQHCLTELRFYIPLDTIKVISEMPLPANLSTHTEKTKSKPRERTTKIYNTPQLMHITKFTTTQHNHASGTQKYYNSK